MNSIKSMVLGICILCLFLFASIAYASPAKAEDLLVITYNVESDNDTEPDLVAEDIRKIVGADLWGLSEVPDKDAAEIFTNAVAYPGSDFAFILGTTGINEPQRQDDRLLIIYNQNRLEWIDDYELEGSGGTREPLVAQFKLLPDGPEFLFMVNHFNRREAEKRESQAESVRQWAEDQTLPIIATGDYNFDWDTSEKEGNKAFDKFMKGNAFTWIQPECVRTGSCPTTGTQCNPDYNSILDFVFVSGAAKNWRAESEVLFPENSYCRKEIRGYADHRPVLATFQIN